MSGALVSSSNPYNLAEHVTNGLYIECIETFSTEVVTRIREIIGDSGGISF